MGRAFCNPEACSTTFTLTVTNSRRRRFPTITLTILRTCIPCPAAAFITTRSRLRPVEEVRAVDPPSPTSSIHPFTGAVIFTCKHSALGTNAYNTNTNAVTLLLHGTSTNVAYQLFSTTNLAPPVVWTLEQNLFGSGTTNVTPTTVIMTGRPTLYFKALASTLDSDGDGLPDWWELKYSTSSFPLSPTNDDTGNTGIQDGDKQDSAGDGYSNMQKYQMGIAPNIFISPAAPNNFTINWNTNGNITLSWTPATNLPSYGAGSLTVYTLTIGGCNISLSACQTNFVLTTNSDSRLATYEQFPEDSAPPTYSLQINYAHTNSFVAAEQPVFNPNYDVIAYIVRGSQGNLYLLASAVPSNIVAIRISANPGTSRFTYPIINNYNTGWQSTGYGLDPFIPFEVPVSDLTNGIFQIASSNVPPYGGYEFEIQAIGSDGNLGEINYSYALQDTAEDFIPFLDGRTQIQQNINFQLRSATTLSPFAVVSPYSDTQSAGTNYVASGYYSFTGARTIFGCDEFQPFEDNYFFQNWIYSSNNIFDVASGFQGYIDTDLFNTVSAYFFYPAPSNIFQTYFYVTNSVHPAITSVLSDSVARWIYYFDASSEEPADFEDIGIYQASDGTLTVTNNCHNLYGLSLNSILYPAGNGDSNDFQVASPGSTIEQRASGSWFFEFATPVLETVGYYFPRPGIDPQPGETTFTVTNATAPFIIIPFGQPFLISAWARQSLLNGYLGNFAYPQQYFDKAFLANTNGDISTNETGILSEYGNFFPTQPGKVFLTTKPDGETGATGQCPIYVLKMQLDVNHDGTMDTSFAGPDNTSANRPFRFWVNSDSDYSSGSDDPGQDRNDPKHPDYNLQNIPSQRDLVDWARLWICGLPVLPTNCQATLSWNVINGNPSINLVQPVETNGGTGYLTDTNIAVEQAGGDSLFIPSYKFANVSSSNSLYVSAFLFSRRQDKLFLV